MTAGASAAESPSRLRILVAEDHPVNREVLALILAAWEAEIVETENGAEAVAAFGSERFDVVLMDIQMPVMDGLAAIREIRRLEAETGRPTTPVLAVTANAMSADVAASRAAGADDHISKPIVPDVLLKGIVQAIARHAIAAEAPGAQARHG